MERASGRRRDRVRRRLGALASAAHVLRAHPGRAGRDRRPTRPSGPLVRRRGAARGHDRGARRDRRARLGPVRRRRRASALPQPHAPLCAIDELARFDRLSIAERIDELDARRRGARRAGRRARVAGPRARSRRGRRRGPALARAVGLQPGADAVDRRAGHDRRRHGRAAGGDRGGGAVRAAARRAGGARSRSADDGVEVHDRDGAGASRARRRGRVPLNTLGAIEFDPPLPEDKRRGDRARPGQPRDQADAPGARRGGRWRTRSGPATRSATWPPSSWSTTARSC